MREIVREDGCFLLRFPMWKEKENHDEEFVCDNLFVGIPVASEGGGGGNDKRGASL